MANPGCSEFEWSEPRISTAWMPIEYRKGEMTEGTYRYRTRAPKAEAKKPTVKAPDGLQWLRVVCYKNNLEWYLVDKGEDISDSKTVHVVPRTKLWRDSLLACAAAYDEQHGAKSAVFIGGPPKTYLLVELEDQCQPNTKP